MAKRFLVTVEAPVIELTEEPLFPNEAVTKGYSDELISLRGLPSGGALGYSLVKKSTNDYDFEWRATTRKVNGISLETVNEGEHVFDTVTKRVAFRDGDLIYVYFNNANNIIGQAGQFDYSAARNSLQIGWM